MIQAFLTLVVGAFVLGAAAPAFAAPYGLMERGCCDDKPPHLTGICPIACPAEGLNGTIILPRESNASSEPLFKIPKIPNSGKLNNTVFAREGDFAARSPIGVPQHECCGKPSFAPCDEICPAKLNLTGILHREVDDGNDANAINFTHHSHPLVPADSLDVEAREEDKVDVKFPGQSCSNNPGFAGICPPNEPLLSPNSTVNDLAKRGSPGSGLRDLFERKMGTMDLD